jgi:hypothetical protein
MSTAERSLFPGRLTPRLARLFLSTQFVPAESDMTKPGRSGRASKGDLCVSSDGRSAARS